MIRARIQARDEAGVSGRYVAVAAQAALTAGAVQRERYGSEIQIEYKGEIDLVTEVDRACERAIVEVIRARFPGDDIVTEETSFARRGSRAVWFVDPLDGTVNFAHGYPVFCASVAVALDGRVVAGAIYDPVKEELFTAERGAGAHCNGRRLRVSRARELIESLLVTGFPYDVHEDLPNKLRFFNRLMGLARAVRRDGSAALDLAYLAAGRFDGFWEERLNSWDMLAGNLMVEEAGGRVSRFDGAPLGLEADEVLATNGLIHEAMAAVLVDTAKAGVAE
jgi:myo-inositol-1(or 4)-monophosphatase